LSCADWVQGVSEIRGVRIGCVEALGVGIAMGIVIWVEGLREHIDREDTGRLRMV
jgi:hypothetical protein